MFDNRQLATLILLGTLLACALIVRSTRQAVATPFRMLVKPKILIPFLLYGAWLFGLHWLSWRVGLWNAELIGESIFWAGASGLALLTLAVTDAGKKDNFFRNRAVETIKFGTFFEFFLNIKSLNLLGELLLQPFVALLAACQIIAAHDEKYASSRKRLNVVLFLMALSFLIYTVTFLVQDWSQIDKGQELRKALMPIWLTLGAMPFAFVFALVAGYGQVFFRMKATREFERTSLRARLGVMLALRSRLLDINDFAGRHAQQAGRARTMRGGIKAVHDFRAERARKAAEEQARLDRLAAYAGVEGVDEAGRRLDQREFKETKNALRRLATYQMGWHNNQGKHYRPDLLTKSCDFQREGLPADHGIVMKVRRDGKAWFAYRRTVTGWVLGIGARRPPPDQWFYDGPEPPTSYPRPGHGWGEAAHQDTVNWR